MAISSDQLRDNPWWQDPKAIEEDVHLGRLAEHELSFRHPSPLPIDRDAVLALRGPRQVGKTTLMKRIVRELLEASVPPTSIMYLDVEGANLQTPYELQEAIREFVEWRPPSPGGRRYLFLDEITGIDEWGRAIRVLAGRGTLEGCSVLCTGSHARDVKRGAERAPGRKGDVEAWDWIMMPLSFRDYVSVHDPDLGEKLPELDLSDLPGAFEAAQDIALHHENLHPLFERYLLTGGFPHAMSTEAEDGVIPQRVYRLHQEAFRGEIVRAGHREDLFRELVEWVGENRLGGEFSWSDGSGSTSIGSHHTVREYLEDAQAAFLWHILYRVESLDAPARASRSPKKLYPADPFTWHVLNSWVSPSSEPWQEAIELLEDPAELGLLVESVVGDHLCRWRGRFALYYRHSQRKEEIDFTVFDDKRLLVKVKYRNRIRQSDFSALARHGGGVLVTKDTLFFDEESKVLALPAPSFLAGLPHDLSLFPSVE
jgi:predicted AAA+ superfamily ATPase